VRLGVHNYSGDPVTSCIVDWLDSDAAKTAKGSSKGWPKGLTTLYDVLTTASVETGFDHRSNGDGPMVRACRSMMSGHSTASDTSAPVTEIARKLSAKPSLATFVLPRTLACCLVRF
jgi:hypothetical protein